MTSTTSRFSACGRESGRMLRTWRVLVPLPRVSSPTSSGGMSRAGSLPGPRRGADGEFAARIGRHRPGRVGRHVDRPGLALERVRPLADDAEILPRLTRALPATHQADLVSPSRASARAWRDIEHLEADMGPAGLRASRLDGPPFRFGFTSVRTCGSPGSNRTRQVAAPARPHRHPRRSERSEARSGPPSNELDRLPRAVRPARMTDGRMWRWLRRQSSPTAVSPLQPSRVSASLFRSGLPCSVAELTRPPSASRALLHVVRAGRRGLPRGPRPRAPPRPTNGRRHRSRPAGRCR